MIQITERRFKPLLSTAFDWGKNDVFESTFKEWLKNLKEVKNDNKRKKK